MTMTSKDTRQRLLDLWEKCPECKPRVIWWPDNSIWVLGSSWDDMCIDEKEAFALACDAMVRWLADQIYCDVVGIHIAGNGWGVVLNALNDGDGFVADTLTDALISAVEAVMGESETLKPEEQADV